MGEYAKRKIDGCEVKIGTCESMYYLRYEQRNEVVYNFQPNKGKHTEWLWRIPVPFEDNMLPGDYEYGGLLKDGYIPYLLKLKQPTGDFEKFLVDNPGTCQQVVEKLGMLINLPCHHGVALPKAEGFKFFWNGKRDALHLCFLTDYEKELRVGIKCNACGKMWSCDFMEIEPYIVSLWMKLRLLHQCTEYWAEHNEEPCRYTVIDKDKDGKPMEICNLSGGEHEWQVDVNDETVKVGTWAECRDELISRLAIADPNITYPSDRWEYLHENREMYERYIDEL